MQSIEKRETSGNLSARELLFKYIRFLPLVIFCVALALFLAWLYLRYTQEQYSSIGNMLITTEESKGDKVEDLIAGKSKTTNLLNEIEVLKSRPLMTRVVQKLELQIGYIKKGKVKNMNAYKRASFAFVPVQLVDSALSFSVDIEFVNSNQFRVNKKSTLYSLDQLFQTGNGVFKLVKDGGQPEPGAEFTVTYHHEDAVAAGMIRELNVQPKQANTGILLVEYHSSNPYLSSDVVNTLMQEYTIWKVEQGNTSMDLTIDFINNRLGIVQHDIDSLQRKLVAYQKNNNLVDASLQITALLERAQAQDVAGQEQRMALGTLEVLEHSIAGSEAGSLTPSVAGIKDPGLSEVLTKLNEAQLQRKSLVDGNVPVNNPLVKQLDQSIELLKKGALENVATLKNSYKKNLGLVSAEKSKSTGGALQMPAKITEQAEIERDLASKLALAKVLGEKREEAAIKRASTISNTKIIEKAEPNITPVKPSPGTVKLVALLFGLAIPGLFLVLKEAFNDRVNTRADIERATAAPILGEIGHSKSDHTLVVSKTQRTLIAEQFRLLRSNLQYITGKQDKVVIMVTSSFGGEGKSFISTNMAAVYGLTDKRTIVLEFDLRKPKVLSGLDMQRRQGISNYMIGDVDLDSLIIPVAGEENMYVLPCGPIPPNPAELLLSRKTEQLFTQLRNKFDYVIIDTAPIGMVSDALTLAKYADCTIYVTRQAHTFKKQLNLVNDMYENKKMPNLSIVLNDTKMPTGGGYYGNYGYGYGEKHGSDYYQDDAIAAGDRKRGFLHWFKKR
ncbi:GumC family protein [Niabella drilacis]|uniref:non-specific protein-tyrosine kinase n=1 Tax=Niabella drilacis (strain DSM 25811 / CCM 8410 / CCUG 62505 / LMG 26954 / E90) TaxID=1285928 RepID=A0A1G6NPU6_NIADE|nr:tyrosine-protein kinase [Niabella drilacis]SDC69748.1 capsular exopolysaccharide family [Niabella drilacis]